MQISSSVAELIICGAMYVLNLPFLNEILLARYTCEQYKRSDRF